MGKQITSQARNAGRGLQFLIVDDDDYFVTQLKSQILKVTGRLDNVAVVGCLEAAVELAGEQTFDVCFLDFTIADRFERVQGDVAPLTMLAGALVVVCDKPSKASAYRALQLGAKEFLIKSSSSHFDIAKAISYALYWKHSEDELHLRLAQLQVADETLSSHFHERFQHAIEVAKRGRERVGLLMIGLQGVEPIVQDYGQAVGGELLHQVGERITQKVRTSDVVAQLNDQQFGAILCKVTSPAVVKSISAGVSSAISNTPYRVNGQAFKLGANIGAATYPDNGAHLEDLMLVAQNAMTTQTASAKPKRPAWQPYDFG